MVDIAPTCTTTTLTVLPAVPILKVWQVSGDRCNYGYGGPKVYPVTLPDQGEENVHSDLREGARVAARCMSV